MREDCIEMISSEILTSRCLDLFEKPFSISLPPRLFLKRFLYVMKSLMIQKEKRLDSWST